MKQIGFFDEERRLDKLSELGDSLEKLNDVIDWELFRPILDKGMAKMKDKPKGPGGRPPYDYVLLFKILVLARLFNLSDDQTEYQINDRMSFMRFLGLGLSDRVPDAKTIWLFRDTLTKANIIEDLFVAFNHMLENKGIITHTGTIIDATFVDAPRQRNSRKDNQSIKEGKTPEEWLDDTPKAKHKLAQKDVDARWTIKNNERHYGYKNHAKVDVDSKINTAYEVTSASVHDSQVFLDLIDNKDTNIYADSAYTHLATQLPKGTTANISEKGYRGHPLTEKQKESNRIKSKVRCRIEHVFGYMTGSMHGITVRSIGKTRADFNIGMTNLVYNLCRFTILEKKRLAMG